MRGADVRLIQVQQALGVTAQAARLAVALHDAPGEVIATSALAQIIHGGRAGSAPSALMVRDVVRDLRAATADCDGEIQTVRGQGYRLIGAMFEPDPQSAAPEGLFAHNPQNSLEGACSPTIHKRAKRGRVRPQSTNGAAGGVFAHNAAPSPWTAAQAWPVALVVAALATGVPVEHMTARTRTGQRRAEAITSARALAVYLAVSGGDASRKSLARLTGFDLAFVKHTVRQFTAARETDEAQDAMLEGLEAQVLDRLKAAHGSKAGEHWPAQAAPARFKPRRAA